MSLGIKNIKKSFLHFLKAPKSILLFVILFLVVCLAAVLIPQKAFIDPRYYLNLQETNPTTFWVIENLGFNHVFSTHWFLILVLIIALMLLLVVISRAQFLIRTPKASLKKWGSFLFHLGLLVAVLGGLDSLAFQKRGAVKVVNSFPFNGKQESLLTFETGKLAGRFDPGFQIHLESLQHEYWNTWAIKSLSSQLVLDDGKNKEYAQIGINKTHTYKGVKIYQTRRYGYGLVFIYQDSSGNQGQNLYNLDMPSHPNKAHVMRSSLRPTKYQLHIFFFPDHNKNSYNLDRPSLRLSIVDGENSIFEDLLIPGQTVMLPGGQKVTWSKIRQWSGIRLITDRGANVAFTGFALIVAGLILLYCLGPIQQKDE